MARGFPGSSLARLESTVAVTTAAPMTFACWLNSNTLASPRRIFMSQNAASSQRITLSQQTDGAIRFNKSDASVSAMAVTSGSVSTGVWHHAAGVMATSASLKVYLDAGSTGSTNTGTNPVGLNEFTLGMGSIVAPFGPWDGELADVAVWNVALSGEEVASLANGFSPLLVRPDGLAAYWPLIRDADQDIVGDNNLSSVGAMTVEDHSPVMIYPAPPFISYPSAVAAVLVQSRNIIVLG